MPEPPHLATVEEERLDSELVLDDRASHLITKGEPDTLPGSQRESLGRGNA